MFQRASLPGPARSAPEPSALRVPIQRVNKKKKKKRTDPRKKARSDRRRREAFGGQRLRYTRILRADQLKRSNIGINSVRRSARSLSRNLPESFDSHGSHTSTASGLYSFMRKYGGAGFQGVHRSPPVGKGTRSRVVHGVLNKMREDRQTRSSRGPKFAIVSIDPSRLPRGNVHDFQSSSTQSTYSSQYGPGNQSGNRNYMGMYNRHKDEGVVAVKGSIPRSAVKGLRAFRFNEHSTEDDVQNVLDSLFDEGGDTDSEEEDRGSPVIFDEHPFSKGPKRRDDDHQPPPMGGGGDPIRA